MIVFLNVFGLVNLCENIVSGEYIILYSLDILGDPLAVRKLLLKIYSVFIFSSNSEFVFIN